MQKPFLGICLGMQMLFEYGYEFGETPGLGLIPGKVRYIDAPELKIPHMGWNSVKILNPCPLTQGLKDGDYVYYVHSYRAETEPQYLSLVTEYGGLVTGLVHKYWIYDEIGREP